MKKYSLSIEEDSPAAQVRRRFFSDWTAVAGFILIVLMLAVAVFAPLLANGLPLFVLANGSVSFPFFPALFSTDSPEIFVEKTFNFFLLYLPIAALAALAMRCWNFRWKPVVYLCLAVIILCICIFQSI